MPTRFVILHHRLADSEHWDLMLEYGDILLTWQLPRVPTGRESLPMLARRIADHRTDYLDYEGPVSGNRGMVNRIERGLAEILERGDTLCRFILSSPKFRGCYLLERDESGEWTLCAD